MSKEMKQFTRDEVAQVSRKLTAHTHLPES